MSVPPARRDDDPRGHVPPVIQGEIEPERYEFAEAPPYRFELRRREFLATLGGGLLIAIVAPGAGAQPQSGRPGRAVPSEVGAWLHVNGRGHVTGYTGKVEVGQHIRTSLAQAIADELRVPLEHVTLVMGDTDRTPYDAGTFGSQSTPRMAPLLARAAASAREMLLDQAAAHWGAERPALTARDGQVQDGAGRTLTYGELVERRALTGAVHEDVTLAPPDGWRVRGTDARHPEGRAIVTGRHVYPSDVVRPGMLHGRVVRPPAMGATLVSIDDAAAAGADGVVVVRDRDFAGVVAPTERAAARAVAAIRAEWRTPDGQPSSETVYDHLRRHAGEADGGRARPAVHESGDVQRARAGAARTIEESYRIPYIAHVPLETRAAVAAWQDDRLTVWTGTQRPFGVRTQLAEAFNMPEERVHVIMADTGSAYGGKHTGEHAVEAARLARAAGRPVRLVWTRAEEFASGYFRPAGVIDVKAALDASGRLVSWEFDNWNSGAAAIRTPYDVPNQRVVFHPSHSPLRQGSYRALAATANHFAREMHMDAIARALGVDAVEFRLAHASHSRLRNVLVAAAERAGWPRPRARRALGIACGTEKGSYVATAAALSRTEEGFRVERLVVAFECGAIVNPDGVRNQVEGCAVQGLGGALFEAIEFEEGRILNGSLQRYPVPRFRDVPSLDVVLLDRRDLPSAGAGETPIVCVAPAIGSAARAFGEVAPELPVRLVRTAQSAPNA